MLPDTTPIDRFQLMWKHGDDLHNWAGQTEPDKNLLWKEGHPQQIKDAIAIAYLLKLVALVVGTHRSKSVDLPVIMFHTLVLEETPIWFVTRNNFHDLKLVVASTLPINIPYEVVHASLSEEQLDATKKRSYESCKGHSDFDPSKYETDEWYAKWGRSTLLREDGKIYSCGTTNSVYYEGMSNAGVPFEAFRRYEHGLSMFAVEVNGGLVEMIRIMKAVVDSVRDDTYERRKVARDAERAAREK